MDKMRIDDDDEFIAQRGQGYRDGLNRWEYCTQEDGDKGYCTQNDQDCGTCSLSNYGRDCSNNPI